jgi:dolichol kinase
VVSLTQIAAFGAVAVPPANMADGAVMRAVGQLLLVLASIGCLLGFVALVRHFGAKWQWPPEVMRKGVHVGTGLFAMAFPAIFADRWPVALLVALAVGAMLWMRTPAQRKDGIGAALHSVERRSWGDVLLALTIGFLFLLSHGTPILYSLPLAVITLSDSAAALAGSSYGRRIFQVEKGTKSAEGVAVFFVVTWLVSVVMLLLVSDVGRVETVLLGLAIAVFGALVEADSWNGLDNVFVPVGIHLLLRGGLAATPADTGVLAAEFLATAYGCSRLGPLFGLTAHAARGYAVAVFVLASVSGGLAAVLPVATGFAHLYARAKRPCDSGFPDLDGVASFVGVCAVWLFVGELVGPSAIHFFMMTFACAILVYVTLAMGAEPVVAALMAPAMAALYGVVLELTPVATRWHGGLAGVLLCSLAACAYVAVCHSALLDRWRAGRVAVLTSVVPMGAYLVLAFQGSNIS